MQRWHIRGIRRAGRERPLAVGSGRDAVDVAGDVPGRRRDARDRASTGARQPARHRQRRQQRRACLDLGVDRRRQPARLGRRRRTTTSSTSPSPSLPEIIRAAIQPSGVQTIRVAAVGADGSRATCLVMWLTRPRHRRSTAEASATPRDRHARTLTRRRRPRPRSTPADVRSSTAGSSRAAGRRAAGARAVRGRSVGDDADPRASSTTRSPTVKFGRDRAVASASTTSTRSPASGAAKPPSSRAAGGRRLASRPRAGGTMSSRSVADNAFAVLLVDVDRRAAFEISKRLRVGRVRAGRASTAQAVEVSISVGLSHEVGLVDPVELFASAESAMEDAQDAGGARMLVAAARRSPAVRRPAAARPCAAAPSVSHANTSSPAATAVAMLASTWKPADCLTKPDANAAEAPHRLSVRSPVPCASTRASSGTDAVSSVVPAISPRLQPSPSRNSPTKISAGTYPATTAATVPAAEHDSTGLDRRHGTDAPHVAPDERRQARTSRGCARRSPPPTGRPDRDPSCAAASSSSRRPSPPGSSPSPPVRARHPVSCGSRRTTIAELTHRPHPFGVRDRCRR